MRIGIISDVPELPQSFEVRLRACLEEKGHSMERIDRFSPDASALQNIQALLNISDVVIATIFKSSPNIFYEIGLAHGQQKPVVILVKQDVHLPSDLLGQRYIEFTDTLNGIDHAIFSIVSTLEELEKRPRLFTGLKGPFDNYSTRLNNITYSPRFQFRDLYGLHWNKRHKAFEQWLGDLLNAIPSFDVITSDGPLPDKGYDILVWNKLDDSDLRLLGNPIPIELKSVNTLNTNQFNELLSLAKRTNIKGMILATTGTNTDESKRRLAKLRYEHDVFAVCLDRDLLVDVVTPTDLLRVLKAAVREAMYREV